MKRHLDNFEGAFPLLMIGSVLVVYAGILASQEIGSKGHLPLWGLFGGVGAVIVGAGIYSTFLEPEIAAPPVSGGDLVTVPRADWEALRPARSTSERASPEGTPIWWEGPPAFASGIRPRPSRPTVKAPATSGSRPSTVPRPEVSPAEALTRPPQRPSRRYTLQELRKTLDELEDLASSAPPPHPRSAWRHRADESLYCADCDSRLSEWAGRSRCSDCHRGLCDRCAASSRSEDGEVRCNECRAVAS